MITWLMVGLLLFTESACERGKNAAAANKSENVGGGNSGTLAPGDKANVKATADEEDIYRLTCYTCVNVSNNKVSKSCVSKIECSPANVGCVPIDTQKICISCCDTSYCNIESPTNATNATFSRKRLRPKKKKKKAKSSSGEDDDEDEDDTGSRASLSAGSAGGAALLGAAISVFLNRAYH